VKSSKSKIDDLTTELTSTPIPFKRFLPLTKHESYFAESTAASSIGKMPGSCGDLQQIGHKRSGLFSIMERNKIVNVYCDFTKPTNDSGAVKD
jgi:hypothetical protein